MVLSNLFININVNCVRFSYGTRMGTKYFLVNNVISFMWIIVDHCLMNYLCLNEFCRKNVNKKITIILIMCLPIIYSLEDIILILLIYEAKIS